MVVVPRVGTPEYTLSPPVAVMAVDVAVVVSFDAAFVSPLLYP